MDFMLIAERIGVPVAMLVFLGIGFWRVLVWLGQEVVKPIATSHVALVDETKKATEANSETLAKMTDILKVQSVNVDVIRRDVDAIDDKLDVLIEKHHGPAQPAHLPPAAAVLPQDGVRPAP